MNLQHRIGVIEAQVALLSRHTNGMGTLVIACFIQIAMACHIADEKRFALQRLLPGQSQYVLLDGSILVHIQVEVGIAVSRLLQDVETAGKLGTDVKTGRSRSEIARRLGIDFQLDGVSADGALDRIGQLLLGPDDLGCIRIIGPVSTGTKLFRRFPDGPFILQVGIVALNHRVYLQHFAAIGNVRIRLLDATDGDFIHIVVRIIAIVVKARRQTECQQ